jgi:very-short-patch-repair endonuclease
MARFSKSSELLIQRARENRKNPTPGELKVRQYLRAHRFMQLDFTRQKPIANYIVDFYCKKYKLAIEIDGHSHEFAEVIAKDAKKRSIFTNDGYNHDKGEGG